jgi:hypothetical protein
MKFDALTNNSDADYAAFVLQLVNDTTERLVAASNMADRRSTVLIFLKAAYAAHLGPQEVTDFFCVDEGCVVNNLPSTQTEKDALVAIFDQIHDEYFRTICAQNQTSVETNQNG